MGVCVRALYNTHMYRDIRRNPTPIQLIYVRPPQSANGIHHTDDTSTEHMMHIRMISRQVDGNVFKDVSRPCNCTYYVCMIPIPPTTFQLNFLAQHIILQGRAQYVQVLTCKKKKSSEIMRYKIFKIKTFFLWGSRLYRPIYCIFIEIQRILCLMVTGNHGWYRRL